LLDRSGRAARKAIARLLRRDLLMARFLEANRVDILSHTEGLGTRSSFPQVGWISDFQHLHKPEFFDPRELAQREKVFRGTVESSSLLLVSSQDAYRDLERFAPAAVGKCRVLRFTSGYNETPEPLNAEYLKKKYGLAAPYFHLPNQFWAHKNHRMVVDALSILKSRGRPPLVISTGKTQDYRNPEYFGQLMSYVESQGVQAQFRVLGTVPYGDLCAIMRNSIAVMNPSRFEGWSTTVEEAKSFGKRVLLSDLAVHREQAPARGVFFPLDDAAALANLMAQSLAGYSPRDESDFEFQAREALPSRFRAFGQAYQDMILEVARPAKQ
jgi:glycosyltransferase involved in cell wall biosynthesis